MTNREVMELADVIRYAGFDWEAFIDECRENGEEPHISYDEFLAQCVLESGLRKEREERSNGCKYCIGVLLNVVDETTVFEAGFNFCPMCGRPLKMAMPGEEV